MYATDGRTDGRTDKGKALCPFPTGGGIIKLSSLQQLQCNCNEATIKLQYNIVLLQLFENTDVSSTVVLLAKLTEGKNRCSKVICINLVRFCGTDGGLNSAHFADVAYKGTKPMQICSHTLHFLTESIAAIVFV